MTLQFELCCPSFIHHHLQLNNQPYCGKMKIIENSYASKPKITRITNIWLNQYLQSLIVFLPSKIR